MASGTAYRREQPQNPWCPRNHNVELYKAPPNKAATTRTRSRIPMIDRYALPPEILHEILLNLDFPSLGMLRRVDTTRRYWVESLPAYSLLKKHASCALHNMHTKKCLSYFPISWLLAEFRHPWCRTCGDFGPLLYMATLTRSCYMCNERRPEYELAAVDAVCCHFALTLKDLKSTPIISSDQYKHRERLTDYSGAKALGRKLHGSHQKMKQACQDNKERREQNHKRRL
ncbi:hypothetical protein FE257_004911 [Aspergillus nanangensis]|uniref:F-box domain-containing protein n=1 Tax=Aspergillus nanangensis TaxID=2582783 RepID=A0AAD4GMY4_ASPNN|nr:hypothetical protein FE257_004911 [Aspergillus nanangensis]